MENEDKKHLVCAIYTRKSTSEGLDQDFSSLDNQRESAENYIRSQQNEGWVASNERYDDGGFTGANIERPGLQKLLSHIKEGRINCVVVYKVDRLSRSLLDFSQLLEFFDKQNVTFVSITQHFNTNNSMGRLTLNILLSFAQFEREIISERTKDKLSAARKRGQWLGGIPPFGYIRNKLEKGKIIIEPEQAEIVRKIFSLYLKMNSALEVAQIINESGYLTSSRNTKSGKTVGNNKYTLTRIIYILKNYVYVGKVNYQGQIYTGLQPAIIEEETFNKVQDKLANNRLDRKAYKNKDCSGLLTKILKCQSCNSAMVHTYTIKKGRHKYRYYLCSKAQKLGYDHCPNKFINAEDIEQRVIDIIRNELPSDQKISNITEFEAIASPIWDSLFVEEKRKIIRTLIEDVSYDARSQQIEVALNGQPERLKFEENIIRGNKKSRFIDNTKFTREPSVRKYLILVHHIQRLVDQGRIKHCREAAKWLNMCDSHIYRIMNLLMLCPQIQDEILNNNSPEIQALSEYAIRKIPSEPIWERQVISWKRLLTNRNS